MTEPRWPLQGVKVLDLGQIYNGAYAGFLLAHAGADVVKVEPPAGDPLRQRGGGEVPFSFTMLNTNKRGMVIDLKQQAGKDLLLEMVREADVLLENFAPGALDRLGVGPDVLMQANPKLVYASSTGYGLSGPLRDNLAMDLTVQAVGGVMSINGPDDGPPLKAGLAVCDFMGGVHLYAGIMTALYEAAVTGKGRQVEISMLEAIYVPLASNLAGLHNNGWIKPPQRRGNRHPFGGSAPYNVFECADGHIAIICVREPHWHGLLKAMGREDLRDDPRFVTQELRAKHEDETDAIVAPWLAKLTREEAARILAEHRVPAAPVRNLVEVSRDEHMHQRGMLHDVEHPRQGKVVLPSSSLRFAGSPEPEVRIEPTVGEHTDEVLRDWLGRDDAAIAALREQEVVA